MQQASQQPAPERSIGLSDTPNLKFRDESARPDHVTRPVVLHTRVVSGRGGGPDKTILQSIRYANRLNVDMGAAYIFPKGDPGIGAVRNKADAWNCPFWSIPEAGACDPRTLGSLLTLCRNMGVTVWHGHDYKSNLFGLLLRPFWPMKLVTTVHGWTNDTIRTRLYYHVDLKCLPHYDHVITVSEILTEQCLDLGIAPERITQVANGIDIQAYKRRHSTTEARRKIGIDQDQTIIGVVGRLSKEKGVDRAIRSFGKIRESHPNAQMHIVGDGPERDVLERLAYNLHGDSKIRFWGWKDDTRRLMESFDLMMLPSHTEGLPNVLLEAMTIGVPCASTDVGAVRELFDHGECGLLLDNDEKLWAGQVCLLLKDRYRMATLMQRAKWRIAENYSSDQRMDKIDAVYNLVLDRQAIQESPATRYRRAA